MLLLFYLLVFRQHTGKQCRAGSTFLFQWTLMLLLFYLLVLFMDSFGAVKCIKAAIAAGIFSYSQRMMCTI